MMAPVTQPQVPAVRPIPPPKPAAIRNAELGGHARCSAKAENTACEQE